MKRQREDEEALPGQKKARTEDDDSVDEFTSFPDWTETATTEGKAAMDKKLNPRPGTLALSAIFPCEECEQWTPHCYLRGPSPEDQGRWLIAYDEEHWPDGQPPLTPRTVKCLACKAIWNHQVGFKGVPTKRWQLVRLWYEKKT
jgi:hypothetical protein